MTANDILLYTVGNMFEAIGRMSLVKLNNVTKGMKPQILGKIECFSPTVSLKDRISYCTITEALKRGDLKPGMTMIESSTGNAGIACVCNDTGQRYFSVELCGVKKESEIPEREHLMDDCTQEAVGQVPGGMDHHRVKHETSITPHVHAEGRS